MKRRSFIKTTGLAGAALALNPLKDVKANTEEKYFGINSIIENNPEAVFIMRTDVDVKTNSSAIKTSSELFFSSVLVPKNESETGATPISHTIAVKPNLTARSWQRHPEYTIENSMGIVTDSYFVEGMINTMKGLGINGNQIHIVETNYIEKDLIAGGYLDMVERTGVNHIPNLFQGIGNSDPSKDIDESNIVWKDITNGKYFKKIPYIYPVNSPDSWLINIAKFKSHEKGITGCAKNLQGTIIRGYQQHCRDYYKGDLKVISDDHIVPGALNRLKDEDYENNKNRFPRWDKPGIDGGLTLELWSARCLDNNTITKPALHVIEGIYGRDGHFAYGPSLGDNNPNGLATDYMSNIIIFGKNPFHVDVIATWLGGHEPGNFGMFHLAIERGLSTKLNPMDIELFEWQSNGTAVKATLTNFELTELKSKYMRRDYDGQTENYWHLVNEPYDYDTVSVKTKEKNIPNNFSLEQNYPNPFNPSTTIVYNVPHTTKVSIKIYNMQGQLLDVLVDRFHRKGKFTAIWNASKYASGTYVYQLETTNGFTLAKKMILLK